MIIKTRRKSTAAQKKTEMMGIIFLIAYGVPGAAVAHWRPWYPNTELSQHLHPSLNPYHYHPLFQGLGTLAESVPLEGYSLLQDCGDAPGASATTTYPIVVIATSFVDNHHPFGPPPSNQPPLPTSSCYQQERGTLQPPPIGQHNSKPDGPIQTGTNSPHFHTGCQHLS